MAHHVLGRGNRWDFEHRHEEPVRRMNDNHQNRSRIACTRPLQLLVVSPDSVARDLTSVIFKHAGHVVSTAGTAAEADRLMQTGTYDAVVLDGRQGAVGAAELCLDLIAGWPGQPCILMRAGPGTGTSEVIRNGSGVAVVERPFDGNALLQALASVYPPSRWDEITEG
jgi:DNA-binding response OmpR family regulator